MNIKTQLLGTNHRCRPKGNYKVTSITIHSTGNPSSTAANERAWLDNSINNRDASWHYVVGEREIIQAIPDCEEAWHCGKAKGNKESIGIEICESGNRQKTLENAAELVAKKLQEYRFGIEQIKKHYDWTGKNCPRILINQNYIKNHMEWNWFLNLVTKKLNGYGEDKHMDKRFNTIEEIPAWAKEVIQDFINKGKFADKNKLDLSLDMIRTFVILSR